LDGAPGALVLGALLGQDQAPVLVLLGEHQGLDLIAHLDHLAGVDIVLDGELAGGDHALGLVADVEQDLVTIDLDDGSLDDVPIVEVLDRGVDCGEEVLSGADVVDGYLRGRGVGGHMVGCSGVDRNRRWAEISRVRTHATVNCTLRARRPHTPSRPTSRLAPYGLRLYAKHSP